VADAFWVPLHAVEEADVAGTGNSAYPTPKTTHAEIITIKARYP
jgi:hypothetical protein